jgi:hypothetical protein
LDRLKRAVIEDLGREVLDRRHTGRAQVDKFHRGLGRHVSDLAVNVAARIMAEATAGRILVSDAVHSMVAWSGFVTLGRELPFSTEHRAQRDLARHEQVKGSNLFPGSSGSKGAPQMVVTEIDPASRTALSLEPSSALTVV